LRTTLVGGYRPCRDPAQFRHELGQCPGAAIVLVHAADLAEAARAVDLAGWLAADAASDHPERLLLLYSSGWTVWGDCDRDESLRQFGAALPAEQWQVRWAALPWTHLSGPARPAAWLGCLGRVRLPLGLVCQRFTDWQGEACRSVVADLPLTDEAGFVREVGRGLVGLTLLGHDLDAGHNYPEPERRRRLHKTGDRLWLAEGLAESRQWTGRAVPLLAGVRAVLQRLFADGVGLSNADRDRWAPYVADAHNLLRQHAPNAWGRATASR
jgi:hypothetical protein